MTIKLLSADKAMAERILNGCALYELKAKYNRSTSPYVHVGVNTEDDVVNIFWLGANISQSKIETALLKSSY